MYRYIIYFRHNIKLNSLKGGLRHLWIWIILGLAFVLFLGSLKDGAVDMDTGFFDDETDDDEDDLLEEFLLLDLLDEEDEER